MSVKSWLVLALAFFTGHAHGQARWKPVERVLFPEEKLLQRTYAQCDATVKTVEGWIYTPNYPSDYDNYRTCIYVIERVSGNVCKVEMTIIDFDLQDTDGCYADYFEIQDGRQSQRLCGALATGIKKTLYFPIGLRTITMRFQSDGQLTFKGFMLHLKQIKNSCTNTAPLLPPPGPSPLPDQGGSIIDGGSSRRGGSGGCDQTVDTFRGRFTSPAFPSGYPPGQVCRYTMIRAGHRVCKVQLLFKTFQLESSGRGCNKDYLELPDKSRVCGHYVPRKIYEYSSGSNTLTMRFVSDYYGSGRGFDIQVVQIPDSCRLYPPPPPPPPPPTIPPPGGRCDQDILGLSGRFISPGYPGEYGPNEYCIYSIRRPDSNVCVVELDFQVFELEYGGATCTRDYLELPKRIRLCGRVTGTREIKYEQGSNIIQIKFSSDTYSHGRGFDIRVRQIPNSCPVYPSDCNIDIFTQYGRLTSPGYPQSYGPNLRCRFTIKKPDYTTCKVQLLFRVFDVAYSANCAQDYLELPDRSRLCGSYVQSKTLMYPNEHSNNLVLYFVTNSAGSGKGFDIDVRQLPNSCGPSPPSAGCDQIIKSDVEIITSPGYPSDYPKNVRCTYTIKSFSLTTCRVRLEFLDFDIEDSTGCTADYLEIPTIGERLCGAKTPAIKTLAFPPGADTISLVFNSDGHTTRPGFQIRVTQLTSSCYRPIVDPKICQTISNSSGFLTSDNFPLPYNPETDCYYQIIKYNNLACQVNLRFVEFLVGSENDAACIEDFLEIQGTRYCGNRKDENIVVGFPSDKKELLLHFTTDVYRERTGFKIEVRQVVEGCELPGTEECGHTYVEEEFQIVSPGYQSGTYAPDLECKYIVKKFATEVCALEIKYYIFDLEESEDCAKDYFQVGEIKVCGRLAYDSIRTYQFLEDELKMTFRTDEHRNSAGFFLSAKQIKC